MRPNQRDHAPAEFFRREYGRLVAYTRKLVRETAGQDPEDIVQDVAAGLFGLADIGRPVENLSAYVYQSLRNRVIDLFRKKRPTVSLDSDEDDDRPSPGALLRDERLETDTIVERRDLARRLSHAMDRLNDREKAVVIATELEERSFEDLSREWGEPVGTLLSRKSRAVARLEKILSETGDRDKPAHPGKNKGGRR